MRVKLNAEQFLNFIKPEMVVLLDDATILYIASVDTKNKSYERAAFSGNIFIDCRNVEFGSMRYWYIIEDYIGGKTDRNIQKQQAEKFLKLLVK